MFRRFTAKRYKRATLIIVACLAFFAGIVWARIDSSADGWWTLAALPFLLINIRRHNLAALACLALCCFCFGWWRGSVVGEQYSLYQEVAKQQITIVGRATDDAVYGKRYQLSFGLDHMRIIAPLQKDLPGRITVSGFGARAVYRGDEVLVTGKLYPTRGNSQATVSFAELRVVQHHSTWIDTLRRKFAAGLQSALPEPQASFGLGLLIGQRSTLPTEIADTLLAVGLTHIIAVSGYNLTIIVDAARRLFGGRSKFQMLAACVLLITTFLLLTGNSPSIVRASIISTLSILAWYWGRKFHPVALLLLAAAATVVVNPLYLWGNVSWYLSFLAFFGIVVVAPLITERFYKDREPPLIPKILIESLCAELTTLPYILYIFGEMSHVSLLANVLVVVCIPLAMLLCAVAGVAGMLIPGLAGWVAWPARWVLTYMLEAAQWLSRVPHGYAKGIGFSLPMLIFSYALLGGVLLLMQYKSRQNGGIITDKKAAK